MFSGCKFYIGLCDTKFDKYEYGVGDRPNSFGLFTDGKIYLEGDEFRSRVWAFGAGAVIGCGIELIGANGNGGGKPNGRVLFFTKNGKRCGW